MKTIISLFFIFFMQISFAQKSNEKPLVLKYYSAEKINTKTLDKIYKKVLKYIKTTDNESINILKKDPKVQFEYSIETQKRDDKNYFFLGLFDDNSEHDSIIKWLYINKKTFVLYEYDLPNDELIKYKKQ